MKCLDRLKKLNRSTKIGLAGSIIYSVATFALPSFANTLENPVQQKTVQQEDLSQLSALELKTRYESELNAATKDNRIYSPEVEKLDRILGIYLDAKSKVKESFDIVEQVKEQRTNIILDDSLDSIVKDFENKLLFHYPDLLSNKTAARYDAFKKIPEQEIFKRLINRLYNLAYDHQGEKEHFRTLLNKDSYEVKDLMVFDNLLTNVRREYKEHDKNVEYKKLYVSDKQLMTVKKAYESYLKARDKEFAEAKRYWSPGGILAGREGIAGGWVGLTNSLTSEIKEELKSAFELQGYDTNGYFCRVRIEENLFSHAGFKGKFSPIPWWVFCLAGLSFPFVRNALLAKYTNRRFDDFDTSEATLNITIGTLIDFMHPWVFPIRMFGIPFVTEPLRKIFRSH